MAANITVTPILRNTYLGSNNGRQSIIIHMTDLQTTEKIRALCKNNEELGLANMTMPDVRMDVDIHLGSIQLITAKIIRRDSYFTTLLVASYHDFYALRQPEDNT